MEASRWLMQPSSIVSFYWDIENCNVPSGKSALDVVYLLRNTFKCWGSEVEFICVCDVRKESLRIVSELNLAQVTVVHVCATSKNAADDKLKGFLRKFASTYRPPGAIVLLSSDMDFAAELNDLRFRCGFQIIVVHTSSVSPALLACADYAYNFNDLTNDLPRRTDSQMWSPYNSLNSNCLEIIGIPTSLNWNKFRRCVENLVGNFGGKFKYMQHTDVSTRKLVLKFPNPDASARAKNRLSNTTIFGRKFVVHFCVDLEFGVKHEAFLQYNHNAAHSNQPDPLCNAIDAFVQEDQHQQYEANGVAASCSTVPPDLLCHENQSPQKPLAFSVKLEASEHCDLASSSEETIELANARPFLFYDQPQLIEAKQSLNSPSTTAKEEFSGFFPGENWHFTFDPESFFAIPRNFSFQRGHSSSNEVVVAALTTQFQKSSSQAEAFFEPACASSNQEENLKFGPTSSISSDSKSFLHCQLAEHPEEEKEELLSTNLSESRMSASNRASEERASAQLRELLNVGGGRSSSTLAQGRQSEKPVWFVGGEYSDDEGEDSNDECPEPYEKPFQCTGGDMSQNWSNGEDECNQPARFVAGRDDAGEQQRGYRSSSGRNSATGNSPPWLKPYDGAKQLEFEKAVDGASDYCGKKMSDNYASVNFGQEGPHYFANRDATTEVRKRRRSAEEFESDPNVINQLPPTFGPIDVEIRNLDCHMLIRDLKQQLYYAFNDFTRVIHITISPHAHGPTVGLVQVPTVRDAQNAVARLNRRKIGATRILIVPVPPKYSVKIKESIITLLKTVPAKSMPVADFLQLYESRYGSKLDLEEVSMMEEFIQVSDTQMGRMISLVRRFDRRGGSNVGGGSGRGGGHLARPESAAGNRSANRSFSHQPEQRAVSAQSQRTYGSEQRQHHSLPPSQLRRWNSSAALPPQPLQRFGSVMGAAKEASAGLKSERPAFSRCNSNTKSDASSSVDMITKYLNRACSLSGESNVGIRGANCPTLAKVTLSLRVLSANVHHLLQRYAKGGLTLLSFVNCYEAEFGSLPGWKDEGSAVPLEHLLHCVPGVEMVVSPLTGLKMIQWAAQSGTQPKSDVPPELESLSFELVELLCGQPSAALRVCDFVRLYEQHFKTTFNLQHYGFTRFTQLLEAMKPIIEMLGSGDDKMLTLTHKFQMTRFAADLQTFFNAHMRDDPRNFEVNVGELKIFWESHLEQKLMPSNYGVCFLDDLLNHLPQSFFKVTGDGTDETVLITYLYNNNNNTACAPPSATSQKRDLEQFGYEAIQMLRCMPEHKVTYNRFSYAYAQMFNKQFCPRDYGFNRLSDLLELFSAIIQIVDSPTNERYVTLTDAELLRILSEQVTTMLSEQPLHEVLVEDFLQLFTQFYDHSLTLSDYDCADVDELLTKLSRIVTVEHRPDGSRAVKMILNREVQVVTEQILYLFLHRPDQRLPLEDFQREFQTRFGGAPLDLNSLLKNGLGDIVAVRDLEDQWGNVLTTVSLQPIQTFALKVRLMLEKSKPPLIPINELEEAWFNFYGKRLHASNYGFTTIMGLVRGASHVLYTKGRGFHVSVCANKNFMASIGQGHLSEQLSPPPRNLTLYSPLKIAAQSPRSRFSEQQGMGGIVQYPASRHRNASTSGGRRRSQSSNRSRLNLAFDYAERRPFGHVTEQDAHYDQHYPHSVGGLVTRLRQEASAVSPGSGSSRRSKSTPSPHQQQQQQQQRGFASSPTKSPQQMFGAGGSHYGGAKRETPPRFLRSRQFGSANNRDSTRDDNEGVYYDSNTANRQHDEQPYERTLQSPNKVCSEEYAQKQPLFVHDYRGDTFAPSSATAKNRIAAALKATIGVKLSADVAGGGNSSSMHDDRHLANASFESCATNSTLVGGRKQSTGKHSRLAIKFLSNTEE